MKRRVKDLLGYTIRAKDGDIGHVKDFYFDDVTWVLRYLVADTGKWLPGRKVLLSPNALEKPDWDNMVFPVNLTMNKVENSPGIDEHKPVSRQHESRLFKYFGWQPYWGTGMQAGAIPIPMPSPNDNKKAEIETETNLRSTREIIGYHIEATDGDIGHIDDVIIDDTDWNIRYLVAETRNLLPGKKVIISTDWIENIDWSEKKVRIGLLREAVKNSPEFNPSVDVDKEFEAETFDHYGKLINW